MKKCLILILVGAVLLSGCNILQAPETTAPTKPNSDYVPGELDNDPVDVEFGTNDDMMFGSDDSDADYAESDSAVINLSGSSISCNAKSVQISGTTATITRGGTYIIRGTLDNGMIIVDCPDDKPQLVLEGASITSATSAPLYVRNAKKVYLTLSENTENALINGGSFTAIDENNIDGAIFSKDDLAINGAGSLTVTSPVGHGVVCKDNLVVTGGNITVHSASHGLTGNESIRINGGNIVIDSGKDGIHSEDADDATVGFVYLSGGQLDIESEGDGVSAALHLQVSGGTISILAGGGYKNGQQHSSGGWGDFMGGGMMPPGGMRPGGRAVTTAVTTEDVTSMKGLKAGAGILINGSTLTIDSADDALHSNSVLAINGGILNMASGDDGIHADTDLSITAGVITITNSYEGLEAQNIRVSGGEISMVCTDDGINAAGGNDGSGEGGRDQMTGGMGRPGMSSGNGTVVISGGKMYIQASGDGIDANGSFELSGGYTVICGPNSGDTATLDYDRTGAITGGVFIGTGSSGMAQSFSNNTQGVIAIRVGNQNAGVTITVKDSQGNELVRYEPALAFSVFIYSTPDMVSGETYQVTVGNQTSDVKAS